MKRGFALIELLVTVSIVSLLSSIMYAGVTTVRQKARDSARIQQVRQIDAAVNMYKLTYYKAPGLLGTCYVGSNPSGCIAVSTASVSSLEGQAWNKLLADISAFIPIAQMPPDPCGSSGCESAGGGVTGYVYVAPSAMQQICISEACTYDGDFDEAYEIYSSLEFSAIPQGYSSFGALYQPSIPSQPSQGPNTVTQPSNLVAMITYASGANLLASVGPPPFSINFSWSPSVSTWPFPNSIAGYYVYKYFGGNYTERTYVTGNSYIAAVGTSADWWGTSFCWAVKAVDFGGHFSDYSNVNCVN